MGPLHLLVSTKANEWARAAFGPAPAAAPTGGGLLGACSRPAPQVAVALLMLGRLEEGHLLLTGPWVSETPSLQELRGGASRPSLESSVAGGRDVGKPWTGCRGSEGEKERQRKQPRGKRAVQVSDKGIRG